MRHLPSPLSPTPPNTHSPPLAPPRQHTNNCNILIMSASTTPSSYPLPPFMAFNLMREQLIAQTQSQRKLAVDWEWDLAARLAQEIAWNLTNFSWLRGKTRISIPHRHPSSLSHAAGNFNMSLLAFGGCHQKKKKKKENKLEKKNTGYNFWRAQLSAHACGRCSRGARAGRWRPNGWGGRSLVCELAVTENT